MVTISRARVRSWVGLSGRDLPAHCYPGMDGERTDRDLALLAQAEQEYREAARRQRSILSGSRINPSAPSLAEFPIAKTAPRDPSRGAVDFGAKRERGG